MKRKYLSDNAQVVDLHIFTDALLDSMRIVAYFRDRLFSEKMQSTANEATVNTTNKATSSYVWNSIETSYRGRTRH